jgi:hypothetical protein
MGPVVVVEVLPLLELVVEQLGVVDDDALELAVELLSVDPVAALNLPVQSRGGGLDVDVPDARSARCQWNDVWNSDPVVGLDHLDPQRELVQQVVGELDRGLLVEPVVDPQYP